MKYFFVLAISIYFIISYEGESIRAGELYIYQESDGTKWLTDRKIGGDHYQFIGLYGRPTAQRFCSNITAETIEQRYQLYQALIQRYAHKYHVDKYLVKAIIHVESCFDVHAVSRVGAEGLMQLMPQTAKYLGVNNSFSPNQNIRGGVRYISKMMEQYKGNTRLALAAYNAGPAAVDKYGGVPPYKETQGYVKKVLDYYQQYHNKGKR